MLRAHLYKEWRELRWMVWACIGLLVTTPIALAWAVPGSPAARLPWFSIALFVGAVTLGTEMVVGDARRRQHDYLARLPGGLRAAFSAKVAVLLLGLLVLGFAGWCGEMLAELVRSHRLWSSLHQRPWVAAWAGLLAVWLMASACWRPNGASALTVTLVVPAVFLAPLVWLSVGKPGISPIALNAEASAVYGIGTGLALAWFGFRRFLAFPRERRRLRTSLTAVSLVFAPLWVQGAVKVWDWHHVDPADRKTWILTGYASTGGRYAYANLAKGELFGKNTVLYPIAVDLEDGSWTQAGGPHSAWTDLQALDPSFPFRWAGTTPLVVLSKCSYDGQELVEQVLYDAVTGLELARSERLRSAGLSMERLWKAARQLTPFRLDDGTRYYVVRDRLWRESPEGTRRELPWRDGDHPSIPAGRGFQVWSGSDDDRRFYDLTRERVLPCPPDNPWVTIRRGAWLAPHRTPDGRKLWHLYWPETGEYTPLRGLDEGERHGPLVDDRRILVREPEGRGLWLADPENGERTPVRIEPGHVARIRSVEQPLVSDLTTPNGLPVLLLDTASGFCFGCLRGDRLSCTTFTGKQRPELLAIPNEDSILVIVGNRAIERLHFGEDTRERLFPR